MKSWVSFSLVAHLLSAFLLPFFFNPHVNRLHCIVFTPLTRLKMIAGKMWRATLIYLFIYLFKAPHTHTRNTRAHSFMSHEPALPSARCIQTRYLFLWRIVSEAERLHGDGIPQFRRRGERRRQRRERERWFQLMCHCCTLVDTLCWCALTQAVNWYVGLLSPCSSASLSRSLSLPLSLPLIASLLILADVFCSIPMFAFFDYNSSIQRTPTTDSNVSIKARLKAQRRKKKALKSGLTKHFPSVWAATPCCKIIKMTFSSFQDFKRFIIICTDNL